MKIWILASMLFAGAVAQAETKHMFFYCSGIVGSSTVAVSSKSYLDGEWRGLTIERKGLFDEYHEQYIVSQTVMSKAVRYNPRNPKYRGMEKYTFDTDENPQDIKPVYDWKTGKKSAGDDSSKYDFIFPTRAELEKVWGDVGEDKPNKFTAYLQMKMNNGDDFVSGELNCRLNWKPN